jgi:hypothetical protein
MLTNELLEPEHGTQRPLAKQSGDDLHAYAQNVHQIVQDVERKHGLAFRYQRSKTIASSPDKSAKSSEHGGQGSNRLSR